MLMFPLCQSVHPQQMPPEGVNLLLALVYPGRCLLLLMRMSTVIDIFFHGSNDVLGWRRTAHLVKNIILP